MSSISNSFTLQQTFMGLRRYFLSISFPKSTLHFVASRDNIVLELIGRFQQLFSTEYFVLSAHTTTSSNTWALRLTQSLPRRPRRRWWERGQNRRSGKGFDVIGCEGEIRVLGNELFVDRFQSSGRILASVWVENLLYFFGLISEQSG